MAEEKKRLEAQLNQLDEDIEEERTQNELMQEKVKRANLQVAYLKLPLLLNVYLFIYFALFLYLSI